MKLLLGKSYKTEIKKEVGSILVPLNWDLHIFVESASGTLNGQTGKIIDKKELDELVKESVLDRLNGKSLNDVKGWSGIPQTLEVLIIRIWEWIEDALPYYARLSKLRLNENNEFFVEYDGRPTARQYKRKRE